MSSKSVKRSQTNIDPRFFIPEGVDEFVYGKTSAGDGVGSEAPDEFVLSADGGDYEEVVTPDILGVIDQVVRTAKGGVQVVDVVLDVEDIIGASEYQFRVVSL